MNEPQLINDWSATFSREYKWGENIFEGALFLLHITLRTTTISDIMGSYLPDYDWPEQYSSVRPKPLFWFRSDTETETYIGRYFRPIP